MSSPESKKGVIGLQNLGLTCYANATLQALRHVERIPWIFTNGRYDTLYKKDPSEKLRLKQEVTRSFADVLQQQENGMSPAVLRPMGFINALRSSVRGSVYEQFCQTAPHDSHEFLMFMLECLHESTAMEVEMEIMKSQPTNDTEKRVIQALECWKKEFSKEYSPLVDLFHGLMHVRTTCSSCKATTHRWESFNTLKAVVPTNTDTEVDILSMLKKDMMGEDIEGYSCDTCSPIRTTAHRCSFIWRLPQTLILCLKRFTYDGRKIHTKITAPSLLDTVSLFSGESPEKGGRTEYSLRSIVDHHGGAGGGHYTAQCKDKIDGTWYLYDDEMARPMTGPHIGETTYVLFYERSK